MPAGGWCLRPIPQPFYFPTNSAGHLGRPIFIGCYIIGMAVAFFTAYPAFAPEWRLLVTTGFCGGLTTFSTFSAEVVILLQSGRTLWALGRRGRPFVGSLLMTFAGIATSSGSRASVRLKG